jgi:hypothetical protein
VYKASSACHCPLLLHSARARTNPPAAEPPIDGQVRRAERLHVPPEAMVTAGNLTLRSGRRCHANSARARQRCPVVSSQPLAVGGRLEQEEASNNTVVCDDGCEDNRFDEDPSIFASCAPYVLKI